MDRDRRDRGDRRARREVHLGLRRATDQLLAWTDDGALLLCADGEAVEFLDGTTGESLPDSATLRRIECGAEVVAFAVDPTGTRLATGHVETVLKVWDLRTGLLLRKASFPHPREARDDEQLSSIAWSPTGEELAVATRDRTHVFVVSADHLRTRWSRSYPGTHPEEGVQLAWGPDGARLDYAVACGHGLLHSAVPGEANADVVHQHAALPRFAGGVAVVAQQGAPRLLDARTGQARW